VSTTHLGNTLTSAGALVFFSGVAFVARRRMQTLFNRRIMLMGLFVYVATTILSLGAWSLGASVAEAQILMLCLWGTLATSFAITLEIWLLPSAIVYFIAFAITVRDQDLRFYAMSATNLVFTINAIARWAPSSFRPAQPG
jgi:hypothetical protein